MPQPQYHIAAMLMESEWAGTDGHGVYGWLYINTRPGQAFPAWFVTPYPYSNPEQSIKDYLTAWAKNNNLIPSSATPHCEFFGLSPDWRTTPTPLPEPVLIPEEEV